MYVAMFSPAILLLLLVTQGCAAAPIPPGKLPITVKGPTKEVSWAMDPSNKLDGKSKAADAHGVKTPVSTPALSSSQQPGTSRTPSPSKLWRLLPNGNRWTKSNLDPAALPASAFGHNPPGAAPLANSNIRAVKAAMGRVSQDDIANAVKYMNDPKLPKGTGKAVDYGDFSY